MKNQIGTSIIVEDEEAPDTLRSPVSGEQPVKRHLFQILIVDYCVSIAIGRWGITLGVPPGPVFASIDKDGDIYKMVSIGTTVKDVVKDRHLMSNFTWDFSI